MFVQTPVVASSVLLYFHSDGKSTYDMLAKKVDVSLIRDTDDSLVYLAEGAEVACQDNPMAISISHDLSKPFYLSKGE